ncbi:uncharacterized protein [Littorina saxatilis]|uniref:Uncharacterized protein n=1 Tax=Littorina saxatilis TaxID=31220 RepID=A0AAN9AXG3_9CAEN
MGCGRSRHRSPSLQPDKDKSDATATTNKEHGGSGAKETKRGSSGAGKKQAKQADKNVAKSVNKREADVAFGSPKKSTNGKTGEVKNDWQGGGASSKREGGVKRNWQLEEAVDNPPETVMAVYKSSVPASARASLSPAPKKNASNSFSSNGSLLNGGSHKTPATAQDIEMQMEIQDKTSVPSGKEKSSKPAHITSSQLEFFKMLDEKIEKGQDYSSDED